MMSEREIEIIEPMSNKGDASKPSVSEGKVEVPESVVKKQWSNPALRMLGVPKFSLPSRNWLIFWSLLGGFAGAIAYDRYEQKKVRERWMHKLESLSQVPYDVSRVPRRISVFITPPPDDFLEQSMKTFRMYIKPMLNASAVDFDIYTENRQGEIRHAVAEKIREFRRSKIKEKVESEASKKTDNEKGFSANSFGASFLVSPIKAPTARFEEEELVPLDQIFKPKDVLGLYYLRNSLDVTYDDEDVMSAGGVICVGRGAYLEYMRGVHEGLLGPLEKPDDSQSMSKLKPDDSEGISASSNSLSGEVFKTEPNESGFSESDKTSPKEVELTEEEIQDKKEKEKISPYIIASNYSEANFAPQLNPSEVILNDKNVPVLFEQPVYVFPLPTITGIRNWPKKFYKFLTRRHLAEDYARKTSEIIANVHRPFQYKDQFMGKEEESYWPKKWVKLGHERGSEWVQEFSVDERITSRMRVYDVKEAPNYSSE